MMRNALPIVGGFILSWAATAQAQIVYVDDDATGAGDGTSWTNAYVELQSALQNAQPGTQIWVAIGSYRPDYDPETSSYTQDRTATFQLEADVTLYGGFFGVEDFLWQRAGLYSDTRLVGDLAGDDVPVANPAQLENEPTRIDNSHHVVTGHTSAEGTAVIDGFNIIGGHAIDDATNSSGGGIYMTIGRHYIGNCLFSSNAAMLGGAISSNVSLDLDVRYTDVTDNLSVSSGGGMHAEFTVLSVIGCRFMNNYANNSGGLAVHGVHQGTIPAWILNTSFRGNVSMCEACVAGGVGLQDVEAVVFNCLFIGNSAGDRGGALKLGAGTYDIVNCTIVYNESVNHPTGGIFAESASGVNASNCILWGNSGTSGDESEAAQVELSIDSINSSMIQGLTGALGGTGNVDDTPVFMDPMGADGTAGTDDDNPRLHPTSPGIDQADPTTVPPDDPDVDGDGDTTEDISVDHDGNPRVVNGTIDLGAFELQSFLTCETAGDCVQADEDNGCTWWACAYDQCVGSAIVFADMGSQFGLCGPDGTADTNDRFHALNCFSDLDAFGNPDYPCENLAPVAWNVDAGGAFGSCEPDGVCDAHDAFHALQAFGHASPCGCPGEGGPAPEWEASPVDLGTARTSLRSARKAVRGGDTIEVDVYLETPLTDLRGYQLHLGVSGGQSGTLQLTDIVVREPGVLAARAAVQDTPLRDRRQRATASATVVPYWSAFNIEMAQLAVGTDLPGVPVAPGYLATYVYRVDADARGTFVVELLAGDMRTERTFLIPTAPRGRITIDTGPALTLQVK